jgi:hypothetical protein
LIPRQDHPVSYTITLARFHHAQHDALHAQSTTN